MTGSIFKNFRCSKCSFKKRVEKQEKKAPPCPKCGNPTFYSKKWYIYYTSRDGQKITEPVSPIWEYARDRLQQRIEEIEEGIFEPFKEGLSWEEAKVLVMDFKEKDAKRAGTIRYYKGQIAIIDTYINKFIKSMNEIDNDVLRNIMKDREGQLNRKAGGKISPNTVNKEIATLKHFCTLLSDGSICREVDGKKIPWIKPLPTAVGGKLTKLEEIPPPEEFWHPAEVVKLLENTEDTFLRCYIFLACMGALRLRTCAEFRREWIDWENNQLLIPGPGRKRGQGKSIHPVSMPEPLRYELAKAWYSFRPCYGLPRGNVAYYQNTPSEEPFTKGYLFCHPADPEKMWKGFETAWNALREKVGIKKRFHDLKHTAGTIYQWACRDLKSTMEFLDQTTAAMAMRYIRASTEIREENMGKFMTLFQQKATTAALPPPLTPVDTLPQQEGEKIVLSWDQAVMARIGEEQSDKANAIMRWNRITKDELEKLVWSKPTTQIAAEFEISDVTVGKKCKTMGIELPPRGHWAKKEQQEKSPQS